MTKYYMADKTCEQYIQRESDGGEADGPQNRHPVDQLRAFEVDNEQDQSVRS